jgi:hypothetical protein
MTLISKPYPFPPPPELSRSPIPEGEGENGGIWPQTVYWFIWALSELGQIENAEEIWRNASFSHYSKLFPEVPFGSFNGPDNYSSAESANRHGWTQKICWDRTDSIPMQPSIAWQAFGLKKLSLYKKFSDDLAEVKNRG